MRVKRAFDLTAAVIGLLAGSPLLLLVALAVKLSSGGPALHRAVRVGRDGAPFTVLKFRTMRIGAAGPPITSSADPRITPVGRILRRLKIDELPQLVNVVRGEMSLVGPRPEDPRYVEGYTAVQRRVLTVPPGITSPASLAYRDEERLIAAHGGDVVTVYRDVILPAKLAIDLGYVDARSFWVDLRVLVGTLFGVFVGPRRTG